MISGGCACQSTKICLLRGNRRRQGRKESESHGRTLSQFIFRDPSPGSGRSSLRPNAKLLYGELSALAQAEGYCWASNAYLAEQLGVAAKTVEGLLKQLKDRGHIQLEVERSEETNEVLRRRIWICGPPGSSVPPPLNFKGTSPQNCGDPPLKIEDRIIQDNNTSNIPL